MSLNSIQKTEPLKEGILKLAFQELNYNERLQIKSTKTSRISVDFVEQFHSMPSAVKTAKVSDLVEDDEQLYVT